MVLSLSLKQKTAYGMRSSDWSSDVCASDLLFLDAIGFRQGSRCGVAKITSSEEGVERFGNAVQRSIHSMCDCLCQFWACRSDQAHGNGPEDRKSTRLNSSH